MLGNCAVTCIPYCGRRLPYELLIYKLFSKVLVYSFECRIRNFEIVRSDAAEGKRQTNATVRARLEYSLQLSICKC
jgi:hypothetical protein